VVIDMEWFEELDFDENPFDTNPTRFSTKMVGVEEVMDELLYRVASGAMVFVEAKEGHGKTSLLWNIIRRHRGKGKVIYVDCKKLEKDLNIEALLTKRFGLAGRLFRKKPRNMILLLDNVSELSRRNMERIKFFFDEGHILSVVFTGTNYDDVKFSKSLRDRIGRRLIKLRELEPYHAVGIVRNRIGTSEMISDELIESLFSKSGRNPKTLLENLDRLFAKAVESKKEKLTKEDLRSV
jgi:chromosomal replication initiation ATPase DnaA